MDHDHQHHEACRHYHYHRSHVPTHPPPHLNPRYEGMCPIELHAVIRSAKPRRILEVGSGSSTRVSAHALVLNEQQCGWKGELTIIEPEPHRVPRDAEGNIAFPGLSRVYERWLEEVEMKLFLELEANVS